MKYVLAFLLSISSLSAFSQTITIAKPQLLRVDGYRRNDNKLTLIFSGTITVPSVTDSVFYVNNDKAVESRFQPLITRSDRTVTIAFPNTRNYPGVDLYHELKIGGQVTHKGNVNFDYQTTRVNSQSLVVNLSTDSAPISVSIVATVGGSTSGGNVGPISYNDLLNKPLLFSGSYNDLTNKPTFPSSYFSGNYADLTNKPVLFSGSYTDLVNKPILFSGNYVDLINKPVIPTVPTAVSAFSNDANYTTLSLAQTAFDGRYRRLSVPIDYVADLTNKPTIPTSANDVGAVSTSIFTSYSASIATELTNRLLVSTFVSYSLAQATIDAGQNSTIATHTTQISSLSSAQANQMTRILLTSDVANANATANTMQDVTGLGFPVVAGTTYRFRFYITYTCAINTTGSRWSVGGPTFSMLVYRSEYSGGVTTRSFNEGLIAYDQPTASNANSSNTNSNIAVIEGIVTPTASGTFIARFASEIASSAITAKGGWSYVEYQTLN